MIKIRELEKKEVKDKLFSFRLPSEDHKRLLKLNVPVADYFRSFSKELILNFEKRGLKK